jgi:hypothetical protein
MKKRRVFAYVNDYNCVIGPKAILAIAPPISIHTA